MLLLEVHDVCVCVWVCFIVLLFLLFVVCLLFCFFPFGINLYVNKLLFDCSMLAALSSSHAQNFVGFGSTYYLNCKVGF